MPIALLAQIEQAIRYNPATRTYDCYLIADGVAGYIGSRAIESDGETLCDQVVYDMLRAGLVGRDYDLTPDEAAELAPLLAIGTLLTQCDCQTTGWQICS